MNEDRNSKYPKEHLHQHKRGGRGHGRGQGRRRMRGRPRVNASIAFDWDDISGQVIVELTLLEIECLRLCDGNGLTQEEAATELQVSRGTIWRSLSSGREKMAKAVQSAKIIKIQLVEI